jgi:hypothetical protein
MQRRAHDRRPRSGAAIVCLSTHFGSSRPCRGFFPFRFHAYAKGTCMSKRATWIERAILVGSTVALLIVALDRFTAQTDARQDWTDLPEALRDSDAASFELETLDGELVQLPTSGASTLIVAYRTTCPVCDRSVEAWVAVAQRTCKQDMIFASAETVAAQRDYWSSRSMPARSVGCTPVRIGRVRNPANFAERYGVGGTPGHYLVDAGGRLRKVWYGLADSRNAPDLMIRALQK